MALLKFYTKTCEPCKKLSNLLETEGIETVGVDAKEAVDWLTIMLKKGNYTDLKFKQIEQQLQVLKTLVTEPSYDTLIIEPSNEVIVSTIKQFTNNLNIK